jgi:hypothetical protein
MFKFVSMEKLVINVPEMKSSIVKQVLHGLGVNIEGYISLPRGNYKEKLLNVTTWSDEDMKPVKEGGELLNKFKAEEW